MPVEWINCSQCERRFRDGDMEAHFRKYHPEKANRFTVKISSLYKDKLIDLVRKNKIQTIKNKPRWIFRLSPLVHDTLEVDDELSLEVGKAYELRC
jgi:hypothetical protein